MPTKSFRSKPILKIGEFHQEHGSNAYISFDERIDIPGLENSDIRIEFEHNNSFAEISDLLRRLKSYGPILVVQNKSEN